MSDVFVLEVLLHGGLIGTLTRLPGDRSLFAFTDAYAEEEKRPTLGLWFKDSEGNLRAGFRPYGPRIMPWFANLLPEGRLRSYLAGLAGVNPEREFFLLWMLGADLPGALAARPAEREVRPAAAKNHSGDLRDARPRETWLRFSLAGVQLKFSAVEEARGGLTIPARGIGGHWIVKLPSSAYDAVPENEFSMLTLARMTGVEVPDSRLIDIDAIGNLPREASMSRGQALAVRRFDRRSDGGKIHQEDFAQVFGVFPDRKYRRASYRNIAAVVGAEGRDADTAEFIRRLTFNMLIGNADAHLKNWSVIYPDRRRAALAPAYDLVSTIAYIADDKAALKVSRSNRFADFSTDELAHLAAKAMLPEKLVLDAARETAARFRAVWQAEKRNLPLSASARKAIDAHLRQVPIA